MSETNQLATQPANLPAMSIKAMFSRDEVKAKFQELLGKRSAAFITSVLQIATQNEMLAKADPLSVYQSAAMAATLDLPLNNSLGFAYIVPYNNKQPNGTWKVEAQFQIGAKGFKQLGLRSGQFLALNDTDVREGELKERNRLTGKITFEWIQDETDRLSRPIIGYASYFKLINGFEKTHYMTIKELEEHGIKYSQTYKKGKGQWKDNFDSMCRKTVIKLNLSKNAPLSVDMQRAVNADQAIIHDVETEDVTYIDNGPEPEETISLEDLQELYEMKMTELSDEDIIDAERILKNKETKSFNKLFKTLQSK